MERFEYDPDGDGGASGGTPEKDVTAEQSFLGGAITVVRRSDDYMAYAGGDTSMWDCGKTVDEAIGKLVRTWPEAIALVIQGIKPKLPDEQPAQREQTDAWPVWPPQSE